ncbi:MAG: hypothetical protein J6U26_00645 [Lachnospiraceae bacterium]|nr:hypothetical protein [Lachnospiraceae bacterium]
MGRNGKKTALWIEAAAFVLAEAVLFSVIVYGLFSGHAYPETRYASIVLCLAESVVLACVFRRRPDIFLVLAMVFTCIADYFLVIRDADYELAVGVFSVAQLFHAARLFAREPARLRFSVLLRLALTGISFLVCAQIGVRMVLIYLALFYIINLLCNLLESFLQGAPAAGFGFVLFLFCDITVGLNGMGGSWGLPYSLIRTAAALTWVFYLPSQVLIVLAFLKGAGRRDGRPARNPGQDRQQNNRRTDTRAAGAEPQAGGGRTPGLV